ncbi:uncharacterized protein MELLADRAFT_66053 [Melampsora larici-populina 98AG31]|uniref:Secreted protein n=1 Tax=Melampsora larici-populina (strain 98AG31 / pathotype 3-4-7) TaxID=747676 RepID=F4RXQ1_MELLP|nr:uncharacterized protein MELLADRAFT_66053 [Melampsora larici-populina 98AG31]EGG02767.1 hypothetical protein MELLADRAFT_66053 [Melampsora larici-populina 98AG31]
MKLYSSSYIQLSWLLLHWTTCTNSQPRAMQYVPEGRMKSVQEGAPINLSNPFISSAPDSEKTFQHQISTSTTDLSSNNVLRTSRQPKYLNLEKPYQRYSFTKERGHENQSSYSKIRNQENVSKVHPHQSKGHKVDECMEASHRAHPLVKSKENESCYQHLNYDTIPHQGHYTYYKPILNLPLPDFVLPNMVPVFYNPQDADDWAKAGATLTKLDPNLPQDSEYQPSSYTYSHPNVPISGSKVFRISSQNDHENTALPFKSNYADRQNNLYGGTLEHFNPRSWQIWVDVQKFWVQKWSLGPQAQGKTHDSISKQNGNISSKENTIFPEFSNIYQAKIQEQNRHLHTKALQNPESNLQEKRNPYQTTHIQGAKDTSTQILDLTKETDFPDISVLGNHHNMESPAPKYSSENDLLAQSHKTLGYKSQIKTEEDKKEGEDFRTNSLEKHTNNDDVKRPWASVAKASPRRLSFNHDSNSISTTSPDYKGKDLTTLENPSKKVANKGPPSKDAFALKKSGVVENHFTSEMTSSQSRTNKMRLPDQTDQTKEGYLKSLVKNDRNDHKQSKIQEFNSPDISSKDTIELSLSSGLESDGWLTYHTRNSRVKDTKISRETPQKGLKTEEKQLHGLEYLEQKPSNLLSKSSSSTSKKETNPWGIKVVERKSFADIDSNENKHNIEPVIGLLEEKNNASQNGKTHGQQSNGRNAQSSSSILKNKESLLGMTHEDVNNSHLKEKQKNEQLRSTLQNAKYELGDKLEAEETNTQKQIENNLIPDIGVGDFSTESPHRSHSTNNPDQNSPIEGGTEESSSEEEFEETIKSKAKTKGKKKSKKQKKKSIKKKEKVTKVLDFDKESPEELSPTIQSLSDLFKTVMKVLQYDKPKKLLPIKMTDQEFEQIY